MGYCNFVVIMGTIVNDIETKVTKNGIAVLNLRIAVKRKYVNDDKAETDFRCCVLEKYSGICI